MIQRKQSLFLALAVLCTLLVPFTAWADRVLEDPSGLILWLATGLGLLAVALDVAAILRFNDRPAQVTLVRASNFVQTALLATETAVLLSLGGIGTYLLDESLAFLLTSAAIVLQLLAVRAIRADIRLVDSMDRIR